MAYPLAGVMHSNGHLRDLEVDRWLHDADEVDLRILERVRGPVLDVGCGPGRHVEALAQRGIDALGMDLTPDFVALAQRSRRSVVLHSVFDPIPGGNEWNWALILDGSIGIGGDPVALLRRVGCLLAPGGQVLVETEAPDRRSEHMAMVITSEAGVDSWFDWATLSASDATRVAEAAQFTVDECWEDCHRWFVQLTRRESVSGARRETPGGV
ncbi:MAG TPA: class I SAM-dependent methyltransferase [Acidimicrobiales bacterium]|nr:class I SAM-dependent methyltransferase [Acidimicrobiales bacterium]